MTNQVVYVLPYVEIDREWKVGNLVLRKFDSSGGYTPWIHRAFCDREGRLIRKPTVIFPDTTSRSSNLDFASEIGQLLQVIQYSISDQIVLGKTRGLALIKQSKWEVLINRLLYDSRFDASSLFSVETFIFETFWQPDERDDYYSDYRPSPYPLRRRREYTPPHVYRCRLITSALAADPLCSTLLDSLDEPQFDPVLVAIRWFNLSKSRNPLFSPSQKLLFRCVAFESLLSLPREGKAAMF